MVIQIGPKGLDWSIGYLNETGRLIVVNMTPTEVTYIKNTYTVLWDQPGHKEIEWPTIS